MVTDLLKKFIVLEIWQNSCRRQDSEWEQGVETTGTAGKDCYKTGYICLEDNCQKSKECKIWINFNFLIISVFN